MEQEHVYEVIKDKIKQGAYKKLLNCRTILEAVSQRNLQEIYDRIGKEKTLSN